VIDSSVLYIDNATPPELVKLKTSTSVGGEPSAGAYFNVTRPGCLITIS